MKRKEKGKRRKRIRKEENTKNEKKTKKKENKMSIKEAKTTDRSATFKKTAAKRITKDSCLLCLPFPSLYG